MLNDQHFTKLLHIKEIILPTFSFQLFPLFFGHLSLFPHF